MKLSLLNVERAPPGMEVRVTADGVEIDFAAVPTPAPAYEVTHRWKPDEDEERNSRAPKTL